MSYERLKTKKIPQLHFKPEGYVSSGESEFLDEFLENLNSNGFESNELVFSGFDGSGVAKGESMPRHGNIFVMNEAAWRQAIKHTESNPAQYAEGWDTPCIGLYDKNQLVHVYSADIPDEKFDIDQETLDSRVELGKIELGEPLANLPPDTPIEEAVVHKDYPHGSPTDALVGVVFLDQN